MFRARHSGRRICICIHASAECIPAHGFRFAFISDIVCAPPVTAPSAAHAHASPSAHLNLALALAEVFGWSAVCTPDF